MFVRVQHDTSGKRPRWRVQVVRNYRVDGKVKQQLLREVGSAYDEETREQLRAEGELHKLALREASAKWTAPMAHWQSFKREFAIHFEGRFNPSKGWVTKAR